MTLGLRVLAGHESGDEQRSGGRGEGMEMVDGR